MKAKAQSWGPGETYLALQVEKKADASKANCSGSKADKWGLRGHSNDVQH